MTLCFNNINKGEVEHKKRGRMERRRGGRKGEKKRENLLLKFIMY